jgi:hypothetical protein
MRPDVCMTSTDDKFSRGLTSETLKAVYSAWKTLAAGRIGPRRAEVTPAHLRRATPWTFTVDVLDGGKDFRIGFTGDRVVQFLDQRCEQPVLSGLTGVPFFDEAESLFRHCVRSARPLANGPRQTRYAGKEHLEREVLLLPLSEDGVTVTALLGVLETWQLGTHPHSPMAVIAD